ncbi:MULTISPECIES: hypothetical protein [unclassified Bradyrhizobium]
MDQPLIAILALVAFSLFAIGYGIGLVEGRSRRADDMDLHSHGDNLEQRARRVQ